MTRTASADFGSSTIGNVIADPLLVSGQAGDAATRSVQFTRQPRRIPAVPFNGDLSNIAGKTARIVLFRCVGNREIAKEIATAGRKPKSKLTWYVPRWAYTRRLWAQLYQILNPASLLRIFIGTAIVAAAVLAGFKWAIPQMVLSNLWPLPFAFPGILLALVAQLAMLTLIPPTVTIRPDKILVQHGQAATVIDPKTVTATYLVFHPDDRVRLRIRYTKNSQAKVRVIGVPPTVDFERLSEMLPIIPVIRDARSRRFNRQSPPQNAMQSGVVIRRS